MSGEEYSCIDAFSGAGGLSLGLRRAGYRLLLSFDNDPECIRTQYANPQYFDHNVSLANIDDMLAGALLDKTGLRKGELFLLAGGPPCQGFSIQRIGPDEDDRNDLVAKYVALVEEVMPRYFLMENVPGLMGKRGEAVLRNALRRVAEAGYWIHRETLDAQDYGVPQRRRRLFVIGERIDGGLARFHFPPALTPSGQRVTVRDAIGGMPAPPEDGGDHPDFAHHRRDKLSDLNKKRLLALGQGQGRQHLPGDLLATCHRRDASDIGHRNVYGRMAWDDVAPTITARFDSFTRGLFGHPEQTRTISLREGAMLQTFPADFIFAGSKVEIARQIGNAVPPKLAEAIGCQIIACFRGATREGTVA